MARYALKRLLFAAPTLLAVIAISFFLLRLAPGGPFDDEKPASPQVLDNLRRYYHFDLPVWRQFLLYLQNLAQGDLGPSFKSVDFSVNQLFAYGLPVSMRLGGAALILALLVGCALGTLAAFRQNSRFDWIAMTAGALGLTIPPFVVAPTLQLIFGLELGWLPLGGWNDGAARNMVLPVLTLALPQIAIIARLTRAGMIEVLNANPMRTQRAYGLPLRTRLKHALRGAALPVASYLGPAAAALMTGSIVVETIFGLPGVGRYFVDGALSRDYTLVMGTVVLIAALVIAFNLLVDLAYGWLDPRVRYE